MRRALPVLLLFYLVNACSDMAPPPTAPLMQLHVGFPPGGVIDTIRIDAVESLPLRAALLVGPDGATTPASMLEITRSPRVASGQRTTDDPWQSTLFGGNAATAAFIPSHALAGAALQGEERLLATISNAEIPLPDPVAYRRDWPRYRIRLTFGSRPDEAETRDIAAPEPPPSAPMPPGPAPAPAAPPRRS